MEKFPDKYNDQFFIDKGYKEYPPSGFHNQCIAKCFQKRFDDEIGKKYFIDVNKWDWTPFSDRVPFDTTYEFTTQLYQKDKHEAVNLDFHSSWSLEDVEEYMEKIFASGMWDYYERWDEC